MGEAAEKLSGKLGIDTTDFKAGISAANRELRVLESGFKANAAALGDWTKDATGLEARIESLTKKIDVQRLKVEAVREEYERVAKEKGENSRAAKDLEIKLNRETEQLNKMERELGDTNEALTELKQDSESAAKGMNKLDKENKETTRSSISLKAAVVGLGTGIKSTVAGIVSATKVIIGMTAAVAGLTVGLVAFTVGPASDLAETVDKTEVVFGSASDKVLAFGETSAKAFGLSKNAALGAASTYGNLLRAMGLTEDQSADMSTELVGLAADLASFNNLDPTEVFDKLRAGLTGEAEPLKVLGVNLNQARIGAKALELGLVDLNVNQTKVADLQNKLNKAMQASSEAVAKYGADSQQATDASIAQAKIEEQLAEALEGTEGEISAAAKAQAAYAIIMEDTALAQGNYADTADGLANTQRSLGAVFEDIRATIGTGFLPLVTTAAGVLKDFLLSAGFTEGLENVVSWISRLGDILSLGFGENADPAAMKEGLKTFFSELVTTISSGATDFLPIGLSIISNIRSGVLSALPILLPLALETLTGFVDGILAVIPELLPVAVDIIINLVNFIVQSLPLLLEAGIQAIVTLALGLAQALPELIPAIVNALITIVTTLVDNIPLIIDAALQLILGLAQGLILALPVLIAALPQIIQAILNALIDALPLILSAAGELIGMLATGIVVNIPLVLVAIGDLIVRLGDTLAKWIKTGPEVGKSLVDGLWKGISANADKLWQNVKGWIDNLVSNMKSLLGISSPSDVLADEIGENMPPGIGKGFEKQMPSLKQHLANSMNSLVDTLSVNAPILGSIGTPAFAATGSGNSSMIQIGDIHVDARGAKDPKKVGEAVADTIIKKLRDLGGK